MYEWPWYQWDVAAFDLEYCVRCCYVRWGYWIYCLFVDINKCDMEFARFCVRGLFDFEIPILFVSEIQSLITWFFFCGHSFMILIFLCWKLRRML